MEGMVGLKYKTFELFNSIESKYKKGDKVYYHGGIRDHHGYYIVEDVYWDKRQDMWRYDLKKDVLYLSRLDELYNSLSGAWESSLSHTEEEGKIKDKEFHDRQENMRGIDPYLEEVWESHDNDPYNEERWDGELDPKLGSFEDNDREEMYEQGFGECRLCGRYAPNHLMLDDVCRDCREDENHCTGCGSYVPKEFLEHGLCNICKNEPGWSDEY